MKNLILALLSLACFPLQAQDEVRTVTCRTICFQKAESPEIFAGYPAGKEFVPCKLSTGSFSKPTVIKAPEGQISFYLTPPGEDASVTPIAKTTIPSSISEAMLLFIPTGETGKGKALYNVKVLDDSTRTFAAGGSLVVNLYKGDVRFIIGEHQKQLSAGKTLYLPAPTEKDDFNMAVVAFQFEGNKGWRTVSENKVRFTDKNRYLLVTYVDPRTQRPKLKSYRDILP